MEKAVVGIIGIFQWVMFHDDCTRMQAWCQGMHDPYDRNVEYDQLNQVLVWRSLIYLCS